MKTLIWIIGIVVVIGGVFLLARGSGPSFEPPLELGVLHPLDNVKGLASSSVVLMEYSDFQCPACRTYYPVMRELVVEYGDRITFVYRHFPLTGIHPNAELAARAAEAARKQGKFWEMHDLLFEKQNEWAQVASVATLFESYATLLGLGVEQFRTDFVSDAVKDFVRAQRVHSVRSGLSGTPSFFINGKQISNPNSAQEFKNLLNAALAGR